jgi:hypothetical protein
MSATLTTSKRQATQQRVKDATAQLQSLIGATDVTLLSAAVTEAAAAEALHNPAFRRAVQRIYEDLSAKPARATASRAQAPSHSELVPLPGTEGARFDPFAPLDPYALVKLYGPQQLQTALSGYSAATLRQAVALVRQKYPQTRPTDARKPESLIAYIVQQLTKLN